MIIWTRCRWRPICRRRLMCPRRLDCIMPSRKFWIWKHRDGSFCGFCCSAHRCRRDLMRGRDETDGGLEERRCCNLRMVCSAPSSLMRWPPCLFSVAVVWLAFMVPYCTASSRRFLEHISYLDNITVRLINKMIMFSR